jgi:phosphoserine phosphatase
MHQFAPQDSLKPFPPAKLKALLDDLEKRRPHGRAIAAFDADGTLWNTDLGEAFFGYKIRHGLVPLPADPWGRYNWMKEHVSHTAAYVWLAQVMKGVPLTRVREWAEKSVAEFKPLPVFDEQLRVLEKLKSLDVEIYIVTASIKWAVEPGARRLGLTDDAVIGIETEIVGGAISETPTGVITYREGKAEALLRKTGGIHPYFCAGNTEGDHWLLEAASAVRLVISSAPEGTENFPTEARMLELAKKRGWHFHRY